MTADKTIGVISFLEGGMERTQMDLEGLSQRSCLRLPQSESHYWLLLLLNAKVICWIIGTLLQLLRGFFNETKIRLPKS